jgi:hypothetical protein
MYSERVFLNLDYRVLKELYYQNFRVGLPVSSHL